MKIAICDDEKNEVLLLKNIILGILKKEEMKFEIREFYSGEELLQKIEEIDIVFLDINMPGMDGIETGKCIKKRNKNCHIIMATGATERYKEAFIISAERFTTKPFDKNEITEALRFVVLEYIKEKYIKCYKDRVLVKVKQKEIQYVEAYNGGVQYQAGGEVFRNEKSLCKTVTTELDHRLFCHIHRQYAVNIMWVEEYENGKIYINKKTIGVARSKKAIFEKMYYEYKARGNILYEL